MNVRYPVGMAGEKTSRAAAEVAANLGNPYLEPLPHPRRGSYGVYLYESSNRP
jgi:hypothetical protein